ncbi:type II secretion system protein GspJ, partial [Pseudomonas aeruginosa]
AMGALEPRHNPKLERHFRHQHPHIIHDNHNVHQNDQNVEFNRGGWRIPLGHAGSRMLRVSWSLSW